MMTAYSQPDLPAPAKVLSLVRLHHGLPSGTGDEIPPCSGRLAVRPGRLWQRGARLNHLRARRLRLALEEIPATSLPAVLELSGGSSCLLLLGREKGCAGEPIYRVQFPDAREAFVSAEALGGRYDGVCVLFCPARPRRARRPWLRRERRSCGSGLLQHAFKAKRASARTVARLALTGRFLKSPRSLP